MRSAQTYAPFDKVKDGLMMSSALLDSISMDVDDLSPEQTAAGPANDDTIIAPPTSVPDTPEHEAWSTEQSPAEDWPQRQTWPLVAAIAAAVVFVGVMVAIFVAGVAMVGAPQSTAPASSPVTTVTVTAQPAPIPQLSPDERYIADLQRAGMNVYDRERAIATGHTICTQLGLSMTYPAIAAGIIRSNPAFNQQTALTWIAAAAGAYCPNLARG